RSEVLCCIALEEEADRFPCRCGSFLQDRNKTLENNMAVVLRCNITMLLTDQISRHPLD
ncbi:Uncharacterized protein DAT39_006645, partial [Clarias magur]